MSFRVNTLITLLGFLTLGNFFPSTSQLPFICNAIAWADNLREFGRDGRDGYDGRDGRPGQDGKDQTIFVDGSTVRLDLSGTDGEDGEDGEGGENARCDRDLYYGNYNLKGADGGNGGEGGDGGNGGKGGDVALYYTNPADLKEVYLRLESGRPGRNGRGGRGGDGCECRRHRWEEEVCTGTGDNRRCSTETFYCRDGEDGDFGWDGQDGERRDPGTITLIPRNEVLSPERDLVSLPLSDLVNQTQTLSKNLWQMRRGARDLLASGSTVNDQYREFVGRIEKEVQLIWEAERSLNSIYDQTMRITLEADRTLNINFPEDVWLKQTTSEQDNLTQIVVTDFLLRDEATQLAKANFTGERESLTVSLVDLAGRSEQLETAFRVKYRAASGDRFRRIRPTDYRTRYEGVIPPELVTRHNNRYTLQIGRLPIESKYLQPGIPVEIEVEAIRSFGDNFAEQDLTWRGEI
jgi:hypothetical protein